MGRDPGTAPSEDRTSLEGELTSVSFRDDVTGYTVARVETPRGEEATVVGCFPLPSPGERLRFEGRWKVHPRFGPQFDVSFCRAEAPVSEEGLIRYLGSGVIRGIGPVLAAMSFTDRSFASRVSIGMARCCWRSVMSWPP